MLVLIRSSLLLLLLQCIHGESGQPVPQLLQLNDIVTDRINDKLRQDEKLSNQHATGEFQQHYRRLALAAELPVTQLDEKISAYTAYRDYTEQIPHNLRDDADYSAFEKRVIAILEKLEVYDKYTKPVFNVILKDEKLLKMLKEKLDALDKDDDSKKKKKKKKKPNIDCCLWDIIFGLF